MPNQIFLSKSAMRSGCCQKEYGFKDIGLALGVGSEEDVVPRSEFEIGGFDIAKIPDLDLIQKHVLFERPEFGLIFHPYA